MTISQLSRRDFLKITASGALGLVLSELGVSGAFAAPPASKGLALFSGVPIYDAPAANANKLELIGKDQTIDLLGEVQGDYFDNVHNTTWYVVDGGYVHSAPIMPVEMNYQKPVYEVPAEGQLAEISTAYSLTYRSPFSRSNNAHRLYYQSTHWVQKVIVARDEKTVWYETYDKEIKKYFYSVLLVFNIINKLELYRLA